jgi:hypothetical protein
MDLPALNLDTHSNMKDTLKGSDMFYKTY